MQLGCSTAVVSIPSHWGLNTQVWRALSGAVQGTGLHLLARRAAATMLQPLWYKSAQVFSWWLNICLGLYCQGT